MARLDGKVAIITGAGSGMGRAMANLFAAEGAKLVVAEWHQETLDEVVAEVKAAGGEIVGVQGDVSKVEDCMAIVQTAADTFGKIDVLCNNAGIMDNFAGPADVDDAIFMRVMSINSFGPLYLIRAAIPHMLAGGGGAIVNSASLAGIGGGAAGTAYTMSKHAVIGLTKNTAWQYRKQGIRCNAMAIGAVQTNIMTNTALGVEAAGLAGAQDWINLAPAYLEPVDVANLALFLASDDSSRINGAVMNVDAGWSCA
jgi:NAD(P)-dependent dehydrogenase (short-subunit alcohol dehydrogenase family)